MYNVGVPFVDEDVRPGWWRKVNEGEAIEEEEGIVFPDLVIDSLQQVVEARQVGQLKKMGAASEGVEPIMPELVEDSTNDEADDEEPRGEANEWGTDDDAPMISVREVVADVDAALDVDVDAAASVDVEAEKPVQPTVSEPRQSSRERRGVPPLRFIEMYLAATVEEEVKQSP